MGLDINCHGGRIRRLGDLASVLMFINNVIIKIMKLIIFSDENSFTQNNNCEAEKLLRGLDTIVPCL